MVPAFAVNLQKPENKTETASVHSYIPNFLDSSNYINDFKSNNKKIGKKFLKTSYTQQTKGYKTVSTKNNSTITTSDTPTLTPPNSKSVDINGIRNNASKLYTQVEEVVNNCSIQLEHVSENKERLTILYDEAVNNRTRIKEKLENYEVSSAVNNTKEHQKLENDYLNANEQINAINGLINENNRLKTFLTQKMQRYTTFKASVHQIKFVTLKNAEKTVNNYENNVNFLRNSDESLLQFYSKISVPTDNGNIKYDVLGDTYANKITQNIKNNYNTYISHKTFDKLQINDIVQLLRSKLLTEEGNYNYYQYKYYIFKEYTQDEYKDKFVICKDSHGNEIKIPVATFKKEFTGNTIEYEDGTDVYSLLYTIDKSIYDEWNSEYSEKNSQLSDAEDDLILVNSAANALPLLSIPAGIILATFWAGLKGYVAAATTKAAAAAAAAEAAEAAAAAATSEAILGLTTASGSDAVIAASISVSGDLTAIASSASSFSYVLSGLSIALFWASIIISVAAVIYMGYVVYKYFTKNNNAKKLRKEVNTFKDIEPENPN
jgi:hypothetical protein